MALPRIGFVGAGQMAQALACGLVTAGELEPSHLAAADPSAEARSAFQQAVPGAAVGGDNAALAANSEVLVLAVKPQYLEQACATLGPALKDQLVVSIVAGATLYTLSHQLRTGRLVRVMPNTPCLVRRGASGYSLGPDATEEDGRLVQRLLESVGVAFVVDEPLLDAVTGLSGSGPAFVFVLMEALADAGVRMGLPRDTALQLAAHTLRGAAELQIAGGEHPAVLKDRVASPGGTTIAGLQALEDHGFRAAAMAAVEAAALRAEELGQ